MLLQKKIDRAVKWSRDRRLRAEGRDPEQEALEREVKSHGKGKWKEEPLPTMEEIIREEEAKRPLEKGDMWSLILSGMLVFIPVVAGILGLLFLIVYLFFFVR